MVPEFLQPWLGTSPQAAALLYGSLALSLAGIPAGLWQLLGRGPRRRRAFHHARRLLQQGDWQAALTVIHELQAPGKLSSQWEGRLRHLEGECHHRAADVALEEQRYEDSLSHYRAAARLLGLNADELEGRVVGAMLAGARELFASGENRDSLPQLLERTLVLHSPCPEASFWQGLCHVRGGQLDQALTALAASHETGGKSFIDPPLYLGALLLRSNRAPEALRYLAEANRVGACPFVSWQLGTAIVAAGGDSSLAVRALQRALGPHGLPQWINAPDRAWVEAFPDGRCHVRRLASRHRYTCPVFGNDLRSMMHQGQLTLAQACYRLGNFQEAADLYGKLLQECPPTVPVLRGLGLALTRLEKYDQAYKHLRTALEQEEPRDPFTAGYLALCGALGKPTRAEDKPRNVLWAIRLLSKFDLPGNTEWAELCTAVFAEARQSGLPVIVADQQYLCDVLKSVGATDPRAAAAFAHLAGTFPEAVQPEYAWLYCKAAQEHGFSSEQDLHLFGLTFRDEPAARQFYAGKQWDFEEVVCTYLERCAAQRPGSFPEELGAEYPARGEEFLLARSRRQEEAGHPDSALASAEVLLKLSPRSTQALDRLARLHYRRGELDRAVQLLMAWRELEPTNHWPLTRRAVIEQQRGNAAAWTEALTQALELTGGRLRGEIAFLGARLEIADCGLRIAESKSDFLEGAGMQRATALLQECLKELPDHADALWCLAAVRSASGDGENLAVQARAMDRPDVQDPRFHYLAAVCQLAAGDYPRVLEAGQRLLSLLGGEKDGKQSPCSFLVTESAYLTGCAHYRLEDPAAAEALQKPARTAGSPSADHARALLGHISFARGDYDDAIRWWNTVDASKRVEWKLDEPLRSTVFLSGLLAYRTEQYEQAAERFREAGRLGLRERGLGSFLSLALLKAGQRLLYGERQQQAAGSQDRSSSNRS
jgi:tetratricopeptide (TPR) repeat protein